MVKAPLGSLHTRSGHSPGGAAGVSSCPAPGLLRQGCGLIDLASCSLSWLLQQQHRAKPVLG